MSTKIFMNNLLDKNKANAYIINIEWERVTVHIDVQINVKDSSDPNLILDFYAVNGLYIAAAKFEAIQLSANVFRLSLNMTNPGNVRCLPHGTYSIIACQGDDVLAQCFVTPEISSNLNNLSRNFLHNNRSKIYTVTFFVDEDPDHLPFVMYVMDSSRCGLEYFPNHQILAPHTNEHNGILNSNKTKKLKTKWKDKKKKLISFTYHFLSRYYRHREKSIIFMSEQGNTLGANLTSVYNRMVERGLDKEYRIFFSARTASSKAQSSSSWFSLVKKLAKCRKVFIDDHVPAFDWLELSKDTELIQLWHAGAGFKSSGYSRWGNKGCPAPRSCHRQYKYGIAGSKHIAPFFSEVFGINDEQILPTGMPRMDEFLNSDYRVKKTKELYKTFPICKGKKVILFAPTYRGNNKKTAYYPYELIDFDRLYGLCGDEYVVLFKMHPWVSDKVPIKLEHADCFLDVGTYHNINDLFYITEILITDYSSNIFEYSLMKKPMLFFAFDKIQYSYSRGFHRDYEESAPGKVCYTFDDIMDALENKDYEYEKVEEYVEKHFDHIDSFASDRVIDWILLDKLPENLRQSIENKFAEVARLDLLDFSSLESVSDENRRKTYDGMDEDDYDEDNSR